LDLQNVRNSYALPQFICAGTAYIALMPLIPARFGLKLIFAIQNNLN